MIPGVPTMGGMELLIILAIILLFFGSKRVPELGRSLGKSIREFRAGSSVEDEKDEVKKLLNNNETPEEATVDGSVSRSE